MGNEETERGHGLRDAIPFLRDADRFFDRLEEQAALVEAGARLFARPADDQEEKLTRLEEDGTRLSNEIEQYLQHAYALKIDRDVLYETMSHLKGMLTIILRGARVRRDSIAPGRASGTTEGVAAEWRARLAPLIVGLIDDIAQAVRALRTEDHESIRQVASRVREQGRAASGTYDAALGALLDANGGSAEDGPTLAREALALEDIKILLRACTATGEYLAYVAVKLS